MDTVVIFFAPDRLHLRMNHLHTPPIPLELSCYGYAIPGRVPIRRGIASEPHTRQTFGIVSNRHLDPRATAGNRLRRLHCTYNRDLLALRQICDHRFNASIEISARQHVKQIADRSHGDVFQDKSPSVPHAG
tara:strand:- start:3059 stop:3454 length:396 start_codon:yes stop_codon:yes gene_type:complete